MGALLGLRRLKRPDTVPVFETGFCDIREADFESFARCLKTLLMLLKKSQTESIQRRVGRNFNGIPGAGRPHRSRHRRVAPKRKPYLLGFGHSSSLTRSTGMMFLA